MYYHVLFESPAEASGYRTQVINVEDIEDEAADFQGWRCITCRDFRSLVNMMILIDQFGFNAVYQRYREGPPSSRVESVLGHAVSLMREAVEHPVTIGDQALNSGWTRYVNTGLGESMISIGHPNIHIGGPAAQAGPGSFADLVSQYNELYPQQDNGAPDQEPKPKVRKLKI